MVKRERADEIALLQERDAAFDQRFFELIEILEKAVGHRFVCQWPLDLSAGCSSGERAGRNSRWMPSGISTSLPVCQPARSKTNTMRLSLLQPTSRAKWQRAKENTFASTLGRMSQWISPLWGCTKP